jgi:hypothetical protein
MPAQESDVLLRATMGDGRIAMLDFMIGEETRPGAASRKGLAASRHALAGELPGSPMPWGPDATANGSTDPTGSGESPQWSGEPARASAALTQQPVRADCPVPFGVGVEPRGGYWTQYSLPSGSDMTT